MIFGFPRLWESYEQKVWPYIIPTVLPLAQIALTGMISIKKNVVGRPSYVLYNFQCNTITLHHSINNFHFAIYYPPIVPTNNTMSNPS